MVGILKLSSSDSFLRNSEALWVGNRQLVGLATTWQQATIRGCFGNIREDIIWKELFLKPTDLTTNCLAVT